MQQWHVDIPAQEATHESGLKIQFEGTPQTRHFQGSPGKVPEGISAIDLVRLIREGYEAYEKAWEGRGHSGTTSSKSASTGSPSDYPSSATSPDGDGAVPVIRRKRRRRIVSE